METLLLIGSGVLLLTVIATAFLLARKAERGILEFREEEHVGFSHRSEL